MNQQRVEELLSFRHSTKAFEESVQSKSKKLPFKFYDGPPFTSGDPHYGHLMQSVVKDMVPRYMAMRGYRVARKRGRDCHGIPAENFVNKQLGITSRKQVEEEFGIKEYIEACRAMVNNVNDNRKRFIDHVGRRVDMDNAYFTMDNDFMESVIHLFADLYHNNLIYKGFKVLGYSRALGTALSNSEIAEGYEMRQDPAVTVKMTLRKPKNLTTPLHAVTEDGFTEVVAGVIKKDEKYLMIYDTRVGMRMFPGGKVDAGETPAVALKRELHEELGITVTHEKLLGHIKIIHNGKQYRVHYFEATIEGEPILQEQEKHGDLRRVSKVETEGDLGFVIKVEDILISDPEQIQKDFCDFYFMEKGVLSLKWIDEAPMHLLARTTTPRTLPSNMFAAVNADITYVQIFDPNEQEYYILAESLLSKYYKNPEDYVFIYRMKGRELVGLSYTPLFEYYYQNSAIPQEYKDHVHTVLAADFVTEESGTGIAHEAPAFGEDDYNLVCTIFPREKAQEWLFDPVDSYGDFTSLVPELAGKNVIASNKDVLAMLKEKGLIAKLETIDHSYPHCPRTGEPLIYKALESRFVKEDQLKAKTLPSAETIDFVPENVKNRFINGLASAPDRNISRTRFRWCPLPVRESASSDTRMVVGSLEEIYQLNTPKQQITKFILVRHGRTDYNEKERGDSLKGGDKARLNAQGKEQAQGIAEALLHVEIDAVYSSPMTRCKETLQPLLTQKWIEQIEDLRLREADMPYNQDKVFSCKTRKRDESPVDNENRKEPMEKTDGESESTLQIYERVKSFVEDIIEKHPWETVVICGHGESLLMIRKVIGDFEYAKEKSKREITNRHVNVLPMVTEYVFTDTKKRVDLHRPYIDDVVLVHPQTSEELRRIPDVLDCRFESGSMPFAQDHYMKNSEKGQFNPTADFIAEGLDQTRGRFRSLHVLSQAYMNQPAFNAVVVTGMILAEDGKKMSKRLKNYPDPSYLLNQYGPDALRLYFLSSPVVRSEPLRFSEKSVEQMLKDFVIPLENVVNFFTTYARIDERKHPGTQIILMRHAHAWESAETQDTKDRDLSDEGHASLKTNPFVERVIRTNPDVIVTSDFVRAQKTALWAQAVMKEFLWKDVEIITMPEVGLWFKDLSIQQLYDVLIESLHGKSVLVVTHKGVMRSFAEYIFWGSHPQREYEIWNTDVRSLPLARVTNELDQRILSELHAVVISVDEHMQSYHLETATKLMMSFIEKLTNRYLRRSRRRFWASGMDDDKKAAYETLFTVLSTYLKVAAPFAPFVTESLRLLLREFTENDSSELTAYDSVHLQPRPLASSVVINEQLMKEVETVRSIITWALYLRAKHQIKVKQPLQTLSFGR